MIKLHIADRHTMLIEGVCAYLKQTPGLEVEIGVSPTLAQCRTDLAIRQPDVLLLELCHQDGNGIGFCKEIKRLFPKLRIVIFTDYKHWFTIHYAMKSCKASGYVLKSAPLEELPCAIRSVMRNETFLCEKCERLLGKSRANMPLWVTVRESQVLKFLGKGYTSKEIAQKISAETKAGISELTVKDHRSNLLRKFDVDNTVNLLKLAMQMGLIWAEDVP
jgi:DNA-binding NarL/FixJ family response regulator